MLKVKKIINDAPSSNMYVLFEEGQNNAFLIDVSDVKVLFNELPKDLNIRGIFLTHTHFDHIAGINELVSRFPGCSIYTSNMEKKHCMTIGKFSFIMNILPYMKVRM